MAFKHDVCDYCFQFVNTSPKPPIRMADNFRAEMTCCFCGKPTTSGLQITKDPVQVPRCPGH